MGYVTCFLSSHNSDWSRDSQFSEPSSSQSLFSQTNSRSDYSQSLSQQPVGGEQTRTEDDNLQVKRFLGSTDTQ